MQSLSVICEITEHACLWLVNCKVTDRQTLVRCHNCWSSHELVCHWSPSWRSSWQRFHCRSILLSWTPAVQPIHITCISSYVTICSLCISVCQTGLNHNLKLDIKASRHSDAQGWASECPDVKNYKWRLNPVWHIMFSCTHMTTVGVKGWKWIMDVKNYNRISQLV